MTNPIVQSITDEQMAELERFLGFGGAVLKVNTGPLRGLIARLRAAEDNAARWQLRAEVLRQLYNSMITNAELDAVIDAAVRLKS